MSSVEVKSMDIKKTQQSSVESAASLKKLQNFVSDVKGEIRKITWTSREELINYTKIVVATTFLFGMAIYVMDLMIQGVLSVLSFLL